MLETPGLPILSYIPQTQSVNSCCLKECPGLYKGPASISGEFIWAFVLLITYWTVGSFGVYILSPHRQKSQSYHNLGDCVENAVIRTLELFPGLSGSEF